MRCQTGGLRFYLNSATKFAFVTLLDNELDERGLARDADPSPNGAVLQSTEQVMTVPWILDQQSVEVDLEMSAETEIRLNV